MDVWRVERMDICVYGDEEVDGSAWNEGRKVTLSALKTKTQLCWIKRDCICSMKSVRCVK